MKIQDQTLGTGIGLAALAALAVLILGFTAAASAQGVANPQPAAPVSAQSAAPVSAQSAAPVSAQPAAPALVQPAVAPSIMAVQPQTAPAETDLMAKNRSEGRHFKDQAMENRSAFEQRQLGERKDFAQSIKDKSFWERRMLTREFNAEQARKKKAFNDEQEKKRLMYEWRTP